MKKQDKNKHKQINHIELLCTYITIIIPIVPNVSRAQVEPHVSGGVGSRKLNVVKENSSTG